MSIEWNYPDVRIWEILENTQWKLDELGAQTAQKIAQIWSNITAYIKLPELQNKIMKIHQDIVRIINELWEWESYFDIVKSLNKPLSFLPFGLFPQKITSDAEFIGMWYTMTQVHEYILQELQKIIREIEGELEKINTLLQEIGEIPERENLSEIIKTYDSMKDFITYLLPRIEANQKHTQTLMDTTTISTSN